MNLLPAIRKLWPLSESYEYAAELGLGIRMARPDWWHLADEATALEETPLRQAQGYRFIRWLELNVDPSEVEAALFSCLINAPERLRLELIAAVGRIGRDPEERIDPDPPAEIEGPLEIKLVSPQACAESRMSKWTSEVLKGAEPEQIESPAGLLEDMLRVHDPHYIEGLLAAAGEGIGRAGPQLYLEPAMIAGIRQSSGALCKAVEVSLAHNHPVLAEVSSHSAWAEPARATGGCTVNHIAVAARWAVRHRLAGGKVGILSLGAAHAGGTEEIFAEDAEVLTASIHQRMPFFPGTGDGRFRGRGRAEGSSLDYPISPLRADHWQQGVMESLRFFRQKRVRLLLVAFRADAHRADPFADIGLSDANYRYAGRLIAESGFPTVIELGGASGKRAWSGALAALISGVASA